jgi:CspA family cold shock protein
MSDLKPGMRSIADNGGESTERPRFRKESGPTSIGRTLGKVKWFHAMKGYGFIVGPNKEDIFAHFSVIASGGFKALRDGTLVMYEAVRTPEGWRATWVERVKDGSESGEENPTEERHAARLAEPRVAQPRTARQGLVLRGANRIEEPKPDPFERMVHGHRQQ